MAKLISKAFTTIQPLNLAYSFWSSWLKKVLYLTLPFINTARTQALVWGEENFEIFA